MADKGSDVNLPGGTSMPNLGLGTYWVEGLDQVLDAALDCGYRLIDTAYAYTSQTVIGEVIHRKIQSGQLKREDIFITTKVPGIFITSTDLVRSCVKQCLRDLRTSYVDLLLVHAPCAFQYVDDNTNFPKDASGKPLYVSQDLVQTWKSMESMVDEGLARAIGVSNFSISQLDKVCGAARIPVSNLQVECHVYLQQKVLREYCTARNISVTAFAPLGNPGRLARKPGPNLLEDPLVLELSRKHGSTPAQILLAFLLAEGVCVIPRTTNIPRMKENMKAVTLILPEDDLKLLRAVDKGHRYFDFMEIIGGHPDYPFAEHE